MKQPSEVTTTLIKARAIVAEWSSLVFCRLGLCSGHVVSEWHSDNHLWLAFRCKHGRISGAFQSEIMCEDWREQRQFAAEMGYDEYRNTLMMVWR